MNLQGWLTTDVRGSCRYSKRQPSALRPGEVSLYIDIEIPDEAFVMPTLSLKAKVDDISTFTQPLSAKIEAKKHADIGAEDEYPDGGW